MARSRSRVFDDVFPATWLRVDHRMHYAVIVAILLTASSTAAQPREPEPLMVDEFALVGVTPLDERVARFDRYFGNGDARGRGRHRARVKDDMRAHVHAP